MSDALYVQILHPCILPAPLSVYNCLYPSSKAFYKADRGIWQTLCLHRPFLSLKWKDPASSLTSLKAITINVFVYKKKTQKRPRYVHGLHCLAHEHFESPSISFRESNRTRNPSITSLIPLTPDTQVTASIYFYMHVFGLSDKTNEKRTGQTDAETVGRHRKFRV